MTSIHDRLEREWDAFRAHLPHRHYDHKGRYYDHNQPQPQEGTVMSLATIEQNIRNGIADVEQHVHDAVAALEPHLGELAGLAQNVEQSPLVQAALSAVLPPTVEAELTALITRLHEQFAPQPAPEPQPAEVPAAP